MLVCFAVRIREPSNNNASHNMERVENLTISDADIMGEKAEMSHEETVHLAELTPEEKAVEVKLRRRIDFLIMPLIILVYLMNYIDR